jgi:hypothetical protein
MKFKDKRYITFPKQEGEDNILFKVIKLEDLGINDFDYVTVNTLINEDNTLSINPNDESKKAIKLMDVSEERVKDLLKTVRTHLNEHNLIVYENIERPQPQPVNAGYYGGGRRNQPQFEEYDIDGIELNNYQNILITNMLEGYEGDEVRNIFIDDLNRLNNDNELHLKLKKCILWYLHENVQNGTIRYFDNNRLIQARKGGCINFTPNYNFFEIYGEPNFGHYTDSLVQLYGVMQIPFNGQINYQINIVDYLED